MDTVITLVMVVEWLAKDLHYNYRGPTFYANHLLADRVSDFGSAVDDLKETYYLGYKNTTPPPMADYATAARQYYEEAVNKNPCLLTKLLWGLACLVSSVDAAKQEPDLPAGIHAVLDGVSQKAMTYSFLVRSQAHVDC